MCEHVQTSTHIIERGIELLNITTRTQTIVFLYLYYDTKARAHTRYNFDRAVSTDNADAGGMLEISTEENRKCVNYFTSCLLDKRKF